MNGWDEIGLTLRHSDEIKAYEEKSKRDGTVDLLVTNEDRTARR